MSRLSWNEIQDRAVEFSAKYRGETYEKGESQSFWSDFLNVFGIDRKRYGAFFEYAIKKNGGSQGFIDMFWPGKLLAEQKSAGRDLSKATAQAFDYLHNMPDHDLPSAIVVSDFATFQFIKLSSREITEFKLEHLSGNVQLFGFLIEEASRKLDEEAPVNRRAAEAMADLHNALRETGYAGHDLEVLLVRLVFCLFADDSGIFERRAFEQYFYNRTEIDGSDFGPRLTKMFEILNTPDKKRSTLLDEDLKSFPYIDGGLFSETIRTPDFNYAMRDALLKAMELDWSQVSPAIFGSMFQGVMDEKQRRNLGAHYTSEKNILKVIKPLFLDDLYDEFARVKHRKTELAKFHDKLAELRFLDPACGCGNFLVITYRELRRLEHKVIESLHGKNVGLFDVGEHGVVKCDVDQMYGIEIEEFPSLIAETALWLTDHQMNLEFSKLSGQTFKRLPLKKRANIHHANALTTPWEGIVEPIKLNYILGNPPFVGKNQRGLVQNEDMATVFADITKGWRSLDFVSCWYVKAAKYIKKNPKVQAALVSTNSITQGEQVPVLWPYLKALGIHINFAHKTFQWKNDARGVAAVHCVILGFALLNKNKKRLFEYADIKAEPTESIVSQINSYLIDAPDIIVYPRMKPISPVSPMVNGSKPADGGFLLLTPSEKDVIIASEPQAKPYIKKLLGAAEFLNNGERYCIWLNDCSPELLRTMPMVMDRINSVRLFRLASTDAHTRDSASRSSLFQEDRQPRTDYLIVPKVTSENRVYAPVGFVGREVITTDRNHTVPNASLYEFGVLSSKMHIAWLKTVCGRLESRFNYSSKLVYNTFVWPGQVSELKKTEIEKLAQAVLDARAEYPSETLANLYDPLTMPLSLAKAHRALDRAVDKLYRPQAFKDDAERLAYLFELYHQKTT